MKHMRILSLIVAMGLFASAPAQAYELTNLGEAGGWDNINKGGPVTTVLDGSDFTPDLPGSAVQSALTSAFGTWDAVESATNLAVEFKADDGGNYDVFDGPNDSNGPPWFNGYSNTLDQNSDWRYANVVIGGWLPESYFGDANILAVTWTGKLSGGGSRKPTWHSEIFFNDAWTWTDDATATGDLIDVETVALHELGHALGLGHENDVPSIMASYYTGVNRTLLDDDIDGITALYSSEKGGGKGGGKGNGKGPKKLVFDDTAWQLTGVTYYDAMSASTIPEPTTLILISLAAPLLLRRRRSH